MRWCVAFRRVGSVLLSTKAAAAAGGLQVDTEGGRAEETMDLASTNFLVTLIIGGVVGWLASILMRSNAQMGILANVIVGVVGSFCRGCRREWLGGAGSHDACGVDRRRSRRGPAHRNSTGAGRLQQVGLSPLRVPFARLGLGGAPVQAGRPNAGVTEDREDEMSVAKVSEISATSTKSFEDAITEGIARANKTLRNIRSAWIKEQQVRVSKGSITTEYQVNMMITFVIDD